MSQPIEGEGQHRAAAFDARMRAGGAPPRPAPTLKSSPAAKGFQPPPRDWNVAGQLDRVSAWIVAAVVVLCPLPFGSTDRLAVVTWCVLLAVALVLADLRRVRSAHLVILVPVIVTALIFLLVVAIQVGGSPPVPPNDVWERAQELLGRALKPSVSVNVAESVRALGPPILIFLSFCCAFLLSIERKHARLITAAALYSGLAYALIGIAQSAFAPSSLLWADKIAYFGDLTGTFVNRNTAGTYFGCCLILWTIRFVAKVTEDGGGAPMRGLEGLRSSIFDHVRIGLAIELFCVFCCLMALLLTHSRAGILFTLFSLVLTLLLQLRSHLRSVGNWVLVALVLVVGGALLLEVLGGGIAMRIMGQGLVDQERLRSYSSSLAIVADFPVFGTGLGTFADVFPVYRSAGMSGFGVWEQAHSVPIELAVELGVPMTAVIVLLWIAGLGQMLRRSFANRRGTVFVLAGFGAGLLGSLHSLVDFSPQIPGFAVFWMALLGCGLAQSVRKPDAKAAAYTGFDRAAPAPLPPPATANG